MDSWGISLGSYRFGVNFLLDLLLFLVLVFTVARQQLLDRRRQAEIEMEVRSAREVQHVLIPEEERVELEEDEEYVSDLIGCTVFHGPAAIGVVTSVDFPSTPDGTRRLSDAAPLLNVQTEAGDQILIPYVQSFLVSLNVERKRIEMKLPEGLLDLNKQRS